ncbi:CHASE2 domain-containing protein [Myxacorys almedinensis]|uniref:CHASE2 domain-containing protein n=1 Tax=Myxacorys almedinensis A TaxID=2690445 RepID=A0A8J7Z2U0_9CYAN|nr:CHASE2 domain-containing protein [Myxacorys almedinensis]NDJ19347.1 CHASE2 domain-containing protein [Myxacorys almedinensis A]
MKRFPERRKQFWAKLVTTVWKSGRIWITASAVTGCLIGLRMGGVLQTWELGTVDHFFRLRPTEAPDDRIVIIGMEEEDIQQFGWPLSDTQLASLLQAIRAAQPRAVGVDFYRDIPVGSGNSALLSAYQAMPNLVGIEQLKDREGSGVAASPKLKRLGQVGFNNVVYDSDRKIRRSLLYWTANGKRYQSFSLKLALLYLAAEGIQPRPGRQNPRYLQLNHAVFPQLTPNDGVYNQTDAGGYQIFANYRGAAGQFKTFSVRQMLNGEVSPDQLRDRIVLIGSVATSLKDFSATPYTKLKVGSSGLMAGVEIQANFISQILSAALDGRPLFRNWSETGEWLWIWVWAVAGTTLSWKLRSPARTALFILLASVGLISLCYGAFLVGWIIPVVPSFLALTGSTVVIIGYIAHTEEELKRSKEFLHRVINSIPDPVFVKDKQHRWIVLNEAYSRFLGKPVDELVEKSDYDIFPAHEADIFWQQDELVFQSEHELEHEEHFTSVDGRTYLIATKRSLHKDAAGNRFLVGVIRDITHRKIVENELRRTTIELSRSNAELRLSQDRLSYLANHDALTGLPNRNLLYERLSQCLNWAKGNGQLVAILFLDLDGFKQINDTLGHSVGDLLLQAVARRLSGCLRTSDMIARLGGDEFVVLLPSVPDLDNATTVAEKILYTLSQAFAISGQTLRVSSSIGIGLYPTHADDLETLMQKADEAMYQAKKSGKNRYIIGAMTAEETVDA